MKLNFIKMVASGNDFVVIEAADQKPVTRDIRNLTKNICAPKFGVGADGMLLLEKSKKADVKMRIFNADGSEAEMCGNGARCAALWANSKCLKIETRAGIIEAERKADRVKIKLTEPKDIEMDIPLKINNRNIKVNFINTGVPHTVMFVEGLEKIDVFNLGRAIRYYNRFKPAGTNVDFVEVMNKDSIRLRTYERGVEDETLACGTGAVAAAVIYVRSWKIEAGSWKVYVYTKGGEILKVYFDYSDGGFCNVWLEGRAKIVYKGTIVL